MFYGTCRYGTRNCYELLGCIVGGFLEYMLKLLQQQQIYCLLKMKRVYSVGQTYYDNAVKMKKDKHDKYSFIEVRDFIMKIMLFWSRRRFSYIHRHKLLWLILFLCNIPLHSAYVCFLWSKRVGILWHHIMLWYTCIPVVFIINRKNKKLSTKIRINQPTQP